MLRFLTVGESHGQALVAMIDGFPAGLAVDIDRLNRELALRQQGYGRGARQKIETDTAEFTGGVRLGITTGAPVALLLQNRDYQNWQHVMSASPVDMSDTEVRLQFEKKAITRFRPGHADLAGTLKYSQSDIRDVLERASARETAARVAAGALCQQLLERFGIGMASHVVAVGPVSVPPAELDGLSLEELDFRARQSEMLCAHPETTERMKEFVRNAWQEGDSVGGVVEVWADNLPVGLGSYTQWDRRIDGRLAQAVMSVQAIKAVELGDGVRASSLAGSQVHDALFPAPADHPLPFTRLTNHAGGVEGGMTNGSPLRLRAYMKPIPTLRKGLPSLSYPDFAPQKAHYERSDVCAVPAASVVVKSMVSFVLAQALLEKFAGDTVLEIAESVTRYRHRLENFGASTSTTAGQTPAPESPANTTGAKSRTESNPSSREAPEMELE